DWERAKDLPRVERELSARFIDEAEDAALEDAFAKPRGRLRQLRARSGMLLLRLVDPARPDEPRVAMAAFDPQFPGAPLFAVARPTLAAPLLDAIRAHARPGDASIFLLAEADRATDALLRAAGARVRFELLHMHGEIPRR